MTAPTTCAGEINIQKRGGRGRGQGDAGSGTGKLPGPPGERTGLSDPLGGKGLHGGAMSRTFGKCNERITDDEEKWKGRGERSSTLSRRKKNRDGSARKTTGPILRDTMNVPETT